MGEKKRGKKRSKKRQKQETENSKKKLKQKTERAEEQKNNPSPPPKPPKKTHKKGPYVVRNTAERDNRLDLTRACVMTAGSCPAVEVRMIPGRSTTVRSGTSGEDSRTLIVSVEKLLLASFVRPSVKRSSSCAPPPPPGHHKNKKRIINSREKKWSCEQTRKLQKQTSQTHTHKLRTYIVYPGKTRTSVRF